MNFIGILLYIKNIYAMIALIIISLDMILNAGSRTLCL